MQKKRWFMGISRLTLTRKLLEESLSVIFLAISYGARTQHCSSASKDWVTDFPISFISLQKRMRKSWKGQKPRFARNKNIGGYEAPAQLECNIEVEKPLWLLNKQNCVNIMIRIYLSGFAFGLQWTLCLFRYVTWKRMANYCRSF